jgi:hypothetical protein
LSINSLVATCSMIEFPGALMIRRGTAEGGKGTSGSTGGVASGLIGSSFAVMVICCISRIASSLAA